MQFSFFLKGKEANSATITLKECPRQEFSDEDLFHESISGFLEESMDIFSIQETNSESRATKTDCKKKRVAFTDEIHIVTTYSSQEYNRKGEFLSKPLTPQIVNAIKRELNEFKKEMKIHKDSQKYTQFYRLC
jgi:hypothetical protein